MKNQTAASEQKHLIGKNTVDLFCHTKAKHSGKVYAVSKTKRTAFSIGSNYKPKLSWRASYILHPAFAKKQHLHIDYFKFL